MKPDLSEFSYGFALTSELIQAFGLTSLGAPEFLSLKDEGKPGGGYDVALPGIPVFLQFKLSDYLTTVRALDYASFGGPYYRFHLRALKHSKQHNLLRALEAKGNLVLYSAPRFHTSAELNRAFVSSSVSTRSVFVRPSLIGALPDDKEHSVSFGAIGMTGVLRSEPRSIELSDSGVFRTASKAMPSADRPSTYRALGEQLLRIYSEQESPARVGRAHDLSEEVAGRSPAQYARFLALSLFDCEILFRVDAG